MTTSKVLAGVVLTTAIVWGGAQLSRPHPKETDRNSAPAAAAHATADASAESKLESPAAGAEGTAEARTEATAEPVVFEPAELLPATQQGIVEATLRGNGRESMSARLRNNSPTPLRVSLPAGQILESGRNRVVVTRAAEVELMPAKSIVVSLSTAALNSSNTVVDTPYRCSYHTADRVEGFLRWAAGHPEVSAPAMQTAILALTENLPLNAVAKFAPVNGTAAPLNTDAFRVETSDILAALGALRDSGVKMETVAMTVDSQLRIEAMIEPLSRETAKRYYGIAEEREWDFWKHELLEGNPSTRHYALFGIARFYPDIALEMLPKWVREPGTHPVYRMAAVQALADTQRAEALPLLRQLAEELGTKTELGRAAAQSAGFLDKRLTELAARSHAVAFRGKSSVGSF